MASFTFGSTTVTLGGDVNRIIDHTAAPGFAGFGQVTFSPFNVAVEAIINSVFQTYDLRPSNTGTGRSKRCSFITARCLPSEITQTEGYLISTYGVGSPVPELSTWAMMLAGFAGLGGSPTRAVAQIGAAAA